MKNVIFKALLCLIPLAFVACGDDSSSNAFDEAETVGYVGTLEPGKCVIRNFRGLGNLDCTKFTLNEADSSFAFSGKASVGYCSGPDVEHLAWKSENLKMNFTYKYSIRGDTMYARLVEEYPETDDEHLREYYSLPDRDSMYSVMVYVSRSHQGPKGTWKYVTSYHESPNVYVNPYMDNVMTFMSIGEDSFLFEDVPNPEYSFAKSYLVESILLGIYNPGDQGYISTSTKNAGYVGYLYPYDNPAVDIKLVSESADKVVFKVSGEQLTFSNISYDINYFVKNIVSFDLEYAGQKCSYYSGYERISQKTCKSENAESLDLDYEYEYEYDEYGYRDYDSRKIIWAEAFYYEYGPKKDEFRSCFMKKLGAEPEYDY